MRWGWWDSPLLMCLSCLSASSLCSVSLLHCGTQALPNVTQCDTLHDVTQCTTDLLIWTKFLSIYSQCDATFFCIIRYTALHVTKCKTVCYFTALLRASHSVTLCYTLDNVTQHYATLNNVLNYLQFTSSVRQYCVAWRYTPLHNVTQGHTT